MQTASIPADLVNAPDSASYNSTGIAAQSYCENQLGIPQRATPAGVSQINAQVAQATRELQSAVRL